MTAAKRVIVVGADAAPWAEQFSACQPPAEVAVVHLNEDFPDFLARRGKWERAGAPALLLFDFGSDPSGAAYAIRAMKTQEDFRGVPVVAVTRTATGSVEALYEAGANSVVVLPQDAAKAAEIISFMCRYWLENVELPT